MRQMKFDMRREAECIDRSAPVRFCLVGVGVRMQWVAVVPVTCFTEDGHASSLGRGRWGGLVVSRIEWIMGRRLLW